MRFNHAFPLLSILICWASVQATADTQSKRSCSPHAARKKCIRKYADQLDEIQDSLGDGIRAHPGTVVKASPRTIVIGVGSGTTATRSMGVALHRLITHYGLKFKVSHWLHSPAENCDWLKSLLHIIHSMSEGRCREKLRTFDYTGIAKSVGALLDYPTYELFIDFFLAFPNARWILTTRPPDEWGKARVQDHVGTAWPMQEPCGYKIRQNTSAHMMSRIFSSTNDFIRCVVPKDKIIEIDIFSQPTNTTMKRMRKFLGFQRTEFDDEEFPKSQGNSEGMCKNYKQAKKKLHSKI